MRSTYPRRAPATRIALGAAIILALSGCTGMLLGGGNSAGTSVGTDSRSAAQRASDRAITTTVKNRLIDDSVLGRYNFVVDTVSGQVILHGTVGSYESRERAARLAGAIEGVQRVDNRIRVASGT